MKQINTSIDRVFNPSYSGARNNQIFKSSFSKVDSFIGTTQIKGSNKTFNSTYSQSNETFKSKFDQKDNTGGDIQIDEIIIFDGGDVYGYETDYQNYI